MDYRKEYERWMKQAAMDEDIVEEKHGYCQRFFHNSAEK